MSRFWSFARGLLCLCLLAAPVPATAAFVTGTGELIVNLPADGCQWIGSLTLTVNLDDLTFTGSTALDLVDGDSPPCPPAVAGAVTGSIAGPVMTIGLTSGEFGIVNFVGAADAEHQSAAGTWSGDPGEGTWSAKRLPLPTARPAPVLSPIVLAALVGLLMAAGVLCVRRRVV